MKAGWGIILALGAFCTLVIGETAARAGEREESPQEKEAIERRVAFLQKNFAKFAPVKFEKGTNSDAAIQRLRVHGHTFEYEGKYYSGFRFAVPEWIDGDFSWFWCFAKTEAEKDFSTDGGEFYIIPEKGRSPGFEYLHRYGMAGHKYLQQQFPYTRNFILQQLDQDRLKPGNTYAIWFGFKEKEVPDIGFAMTIDSARGKKEIGALPIR